MQGGTGSAVVITSETVLPKKFNKEVNEYLKRQQEKLQKEEHLR